jgi:signal transduction histidine kinase
VRIELRRVGDNACVSVADDGPGIPAEDLPEIFERFERGAGQQGRPGFGLGLPLAREIARAHGGRIEVDSKPGRGATFSVWLPVPEHA